jgi:signal transduction histidine kinase
LLAIEPDHYKDEFLATMSHELRTPLNAILGMSEVLIEEVFGDLNPRQLNSVSKIEQSGEHLLSLINDILDVAKLFQPFIQVDSSLSRKYEGTGLGLVLVKQIVELHGGTVSIESEVVTGSCFTIKIPTLSKSSN